MKDLVLFHKHCSDGTASAAAAYMTKGNDALYVPVAHDPTLKIAPKDLLGFLLDPTKCDHDTFNDSVTYPLHFGKGSRLYILDFCLTPEQLLEMDKVFDSVVVLDHHVTSKDMLSNVEGFTLDTRDEFDDVKYKSMGINRLTIRFGRNGRLHYDDKMSGATLAYRYFNGDIIPLAFHLIEDRDLWKWEFGNTKAFSLGFRQISNDKLSTIAPILESRAETKKLIALGEALEANNNRLLEITLANVIEGIVIYYKDEKYTASMVNNGNPDITSELGNIMSKVVDFGLVFNIKNNNLVSWSVRSAKDFDSSFLSVALGGGGHAQASGFGTDLDFLIGVLKQRKLFVY